MLDPAAQVVAGAPVSTDRMVDLTVRAARHPLDQGIIAPAPLESRRTSRMISRAILSTMTVTAGPAAACQARARRSAGPGRLIVMTGVDRMNGRPLEGFAHVVQSVTSSSRRRLASG